VTVVGPTFDLCAFDPTSGDSFKAVINVPHTDPNYGYWEYHKSGAGGAAEIFYGFANSIKTSSFHVVTIKDSVSQKYSLNGTFNPFSHVGKVTVTVIANGSTRSINDKNYGNQSCP
jgi:hypothetical protein